MLSGGQTRNGTHHDCNIYGIAHACTNRKDNIFMQRRLFIDEAHTGLDIFRFAVFFISTFEYWLKIHLRIRSDAFCACFVPTSFCHCILPMFRTSILHMHCSVSVFYPCSVPMFYPCLVILFFPCSVSAFYPCSVPVFCSNFVLIFFPCSVSLFCPCFVPVFQASDIYLSTLIFLSRL